MRLILTLSLALVCCVAGAGEDDESEAACTESHCVEAGPSLKVFNVPFWQPVESREQAAELARRLLGDPKSPPPRLSPMAPESER